MFCENSHMLDTNIVLSMVLPNSDTKIIAEEYLKKDFIRYISDTVCNESQNKILDFKRISLCISEFVKNFSLENSIDYLNISYFLNHSKKYFLNQYDYELPISVPKTRFESMVEDIFQNLEFELKNILINNDNESLNLIIRNSFRNTDINLNKFLNKYYCITFISETLLKDNFKKIGIDNVDSILLGESYMLSLCLNSSINFITFDKGILKLKNTILDFISEDVIVSNPIEFVSSNI